MSEGHTKGRVDQMPEIQEYDKLIKWALYHSITKYGLTLDSATDFEDFVQTAYLRLITTLQNRDWPEHMPSYVVKSARRVVSDYVRDRSREKNTMKSSEDLEGLVGRINRNQKLRLARGSSAKDKKKQAQEAIKARWKGHKSDKSEEQLARHRETEKRRRDRKRIEEQGEVSVPKYLVRKKRTKKSKEEKMQQQKEYRVAKVGAMSSEEREQQKAYQRLKQAEYRARQKEKRSEDKGITNNGSYMCTESGRDRK